MKKFSPWLITTWSVLFITGIAVALIGVFSRIPDSISWFIAAFFWLFVIIWIVFRVILAKTAVKKTGVSFLGNQQVFSRISKETQEAVLRYTDAVNRRGVLKKSALYERPWFLLCGTSKAGKSSLLAGCGLNFPLRYPSEKDGLIVEGAPQVMWYFANEAVWIDTPGNYMEEENKDEWQALIAALKNVRPVNPVDGVALVVDTSEVLNSDDKSIKDLARRLRSRIDELISQWGIEFPVYLLFNRTDEVPGFKEYFGEQLQRRGQEQIFGATLPAKSQSVAPRFAFIEEFNILCKSLTDLRLDKLHKERDEAKKRMICRFVIHFEGIQQKLGSLVAELFKSSSYEGKPIFRGFYFTSCLEQTSEKNETSVSAASNVSSTIINHPLNPNKAFGANCRPTREKNKSVLKEIKSAFVLPLFREIMVKDKSLVKATQKRTRKQMVRHYSIIAILTALIFIVCTYMVSAHRNAKKLLQEVQTSLKQLPPVDASLIEQYKALDIVRTQIERLQKYDDHGAPLSMRLGFYNGGDILSELKKSYFYRIRRFMVAPAAKYLEYDIRGRTDSYGELAGKEYDDLYRSLKAYLLISEAAPSGKSETDTTLLRKVLFEGIKKSILATVKSSRLPTQVETILNDNMGLYLFYLCRGEFPKIQENQRLVASARRRLSRLPGARSLYDAVINKLSCDAPQITLDQILRRDSEGILKSNKTISVLYTQEGFDQFVSDALSDASRNPFKVDWVIGMTKDDLPESAFDTKKLRSDMMEAYLDDFKAQWLGFMGSIEIEQFGDVKRSSRILQKMASEGSELQVLLETVADYSLLKSESVAEKAGKNVLEAASKVKSAGKAAKATNKMKDKVSFSLGSSSPFDNHNSFFEYLRKFVRSSGGVLGGFEGYKDKILTLSEKLNTIETQGEQSVITVFNGKENDPLLDGWNFTQNTLDNMPEELSASLRNILLNPFQYTGTAVSDVLTDALNSKWQTEIVKSFTSRFSGCFPFNSRGQDASFNGVMDFFRPATGTYWGFYDRILSAFIVKQESGWMVKPSGTLQLKFNPDLAASLTSAERIKKIFFKRDGTQRSMEISITPSRSNKNRADLIVDGQVVKLQPGGKSVYFKWPSGENKSAALKIYTGEKFSQDITFNGEWGFMKLIRKARTNKINSNSFSCKWQINVQNTYMVYIDARITVKGSDHPFGDPVFRQFSCPAELILKN